MSARSNLVLATLGIIATFVATFLGVYLAASLQTRDREAERVGAYRALLLVMEDDCRSTLELSKRSIGIATESFVPSPGLMYASLLQNSLLLERMDEKRLAKLVPAIAEASQLSARFMRKVARMDMIHVPPVDMAPQPVRDAMSRQRDDLKSSAEELLRAYEEQLGSVCSTIAEEREFVGSL
jgi:hypothetical protein